ncbi:hypothetical protein FMUND_12060 [Fusarium mundagurra]|uniref:DUF6546 domain-containing protein n=1 Tax=Fusarium mundagurra TaxID=1567541 RepID=A0A8H5Y489_9HYPO|nr:hypothetical protein FMUND_12060 [Fusarium mundagurra]
MANQTTQHHKMRLRSPGCLGWSYLPQEIRRNILHTIVDQRNPRWSALASVSKEWQSVIGTRNMAKLNLRPSCLEGFEQAVVRQRDLVRHIYLNVELTEYECSSCEDEFDINIPRENSRLMSTAVHTLLSILSTWKTTNDLTLELNASSASDSKHWFKNFRFNDEHDAPYARDPVIPMEATHKSAHQNQDYWASFPVMEDELESNLPSNSERIAQISLRLNELSVSFFVDAMDFFEACEEEWTWEHLISLSLTSSFLFRSIKGQKQRIDDLLIAAAKLVLRMPNLTTMALWSGGAGKACAFMYTRTKHYAHITWRGTWDLEISRQVLEAWEDVAKLHSLELRITHEQLRETIRSHGDAIFHLNLPCQVIEPTSLWQIRMEDAQGL